jgi:arabinose-5-phosphate isomerase
LRRALARSGDLLALAASAVMSARPKTIRGDALAAEAVATMERHAITALFIVDGGGRPAGIIHLHDLLRAGVV